MRVVLVGPPGSGKGTQGPPLAAHLGVPYVSTGEALRAEIQATTPLGRRVAALVDGGELVPDDLVLELVAAALDESGGYVLDGFPRTVAQARLLEGDGSPVAPPDLAVHLDVPAAVVHERLARRAVEESRADDDDPAVTDHRLRVYEEETAPLVDRYRTRGALVTVDADRPAQEVTAATLAAVEAHRRH